MGKYTWFIVWKIQYYYDNQSPPPINLQAQFNPIKIPVRRFVETDKPIKNLPRDAKILEQLSSNLNRNKAKGLTQPNFNIYYKVTV